MNMKKVMFQRVKNVIYKRKKKIPILTTLFHYVICFKTVDGESHVYSNLCWCDPTAINCSVLDYYLIGKNFLKDNIGTRYPIQNVISITAEVDGSKANVIMKSDGFTRQFYYQESEIEVWHG